MAKEERLISEIEEELHDFWLRNNKSADKLQRYISNKLAFDDYMKLSGDYGSGKTECLIKKWGSMPQKKQSGITRTFDTGATRDTDEGKLDFEGFLCPKVLTRYAEYMHENRKQSDGTMREGDNWQKGIPQKEYMKSMYRHFIDVWKDHRNIETGKDKLTNLSALLFNVMGMMHEVIKEQEYEG